MKISEQYNVAVFVTNQVMSDPGGNSAFVMDAKKPIGGNIMAHASTTRLYLRKGKGEQRICKIYDSPLLPESEAIFQLAEGGVIDPTD
jgi:meiotic recombination protein DMC1